MIPYLPDPNDDRPLTRKIQPMRWANLGGPLTWFEFVSDILTDDSGQPYVEIDYVGRMGEIARQISETDTPKYQNILFEGPGGSGKTSAIKLLARTVLAPERVPAGYYDEDGEWIELRHNGEPVLVDPAEEKLGKIEYIENQIQEEENGTSQYIQFRNCGNLLKAGFEDVKSFAQAPTSQLRVSGGKRVLMLSELDGLGSVQVKSFKAGFDTGSGALPSGSFLFADTNDATKVKDNFGEAGYQRFHVVHVGYWSNADLQRWAEDWCSHLGISFDTRSFEEDDPLEVLCRAANGAIRNLAKIIEHVSGPSEPVSRKKLEDALQSKSTRETQVSWYASNFVTDALHARTEGDAEVIARDFVALCAENEYSIGFMADSVARTMFNEDAVFAMVNGRAPEALGQIISVANYAAAPARSVRWAAMAGPLMELAVELHRL